MAIFGKGQDKNSRVNKTLKTPPSAVATPQTAEERTPTRLATLPPNPVPASGNRPLRRQAINPGRTSLATTCA
jgi:hypothetical protein